VVEYARVDLRTGLTQSLTGAPTSDFADWWAYGGPSWSSDGDEILLPGAFLKSTDGNPSRPCVAVVDVASKASSCVEVLKRRLENGDEEEGFHSVGSVAFVDGDKRRVRVYFRNRAEGIDYERGAAKVWRLTKHVRLEGEEDSRGGLHIKVSQGLNRPALLVASDGGGSKLIWDPNPQLQDIDLGDAKLYKWKDAESRKWQGGLYMPTDYKAGTPYPLVIQTHGFAESEFRPSGVYPTAFAARALASAGIIVLQIPDEEMCVTNTPREGPCAVAGYDAAVQSLVSDGLVDRQRIGIIGFSRTCFYVMEALTTDSLHLRAASITDGVMEDYWQYMLEPEWASTEANPMIGAPPFGAGLQLWLKRSPGFSLDRIKTPLTVVAEGMRSLLLMWGPYAGLSYLKSPVDLIILNTDEHVLTNPAVRMASQGGSVDWFRFWLQGYEDPDAQKADQYRRWEGLCDMQVAQNPDQPTFCVRSKTH
jgi:hypothetical protein